MFVEAIDDILKDQCTPAVVRVIQAGGTPASLWEALSSSGFLELLSAEADGGAGLSLAELFPVLCCLGHHTVPVPLAQTIVARALVGLQLVLPRGMVTLGQTLHRELNGSISCALTPYGMLADFVLARDGECLLLLPCAAASRVGTGVPSSLTASLTWPDDSPVTRLSHGGDKLPVFAAALHAALLSGAMNRVFEMTLQYCNDRVQFGKSLGKFQAVQHQLSVMAEHTAAASMAAEAAFQGAGSCPSLLSAAMAKSRTSEAAVLVAAIAHALHGAMGVTEEYDLQLLTRCLHEWRTAHGSEAYWNTVIGQQVLQSDLSLADFIRSV
jgi:alkylation response protein AidB-like acyl-CoA dehydrogenase